MHEVFFLCIRCAVHITKIKHLAISKCNHLLYKHFALLW